MKTSELEDNKVYYNIEKDQLYISSKATIFYGQSMGDESGTLLEQDFPYPFEFGQVHCNYFYPDKDNKKIPFIYIGEI